MGKATTGCQETCETHPSGCSQSNSAGHLGDGAITAAEMMALRRVQIMRFNSLMVVGHFLEVAGVRCVIYDARDCASVLLDDAKTIVIANET